ncbi:MAG: GAF domain-containing protein [Phormidesmis sp. RL_2_1]|nr:GAF domain-containing protein [Phormidesmis sp. RL_2_1]
MLKTLAESIARIRQSLTLAQIFQTTATEVRQCLNADRVAVFCLYPEKNWEGEFVSEDVTEGWTSVLAERVYDDCFGERFAPEYEQGKYQAVADIYAAGLSDCHIEILGRFEVRANLVVPVLKNQSLWGLLCIHQCDRPREWRSEEIEFIQHIADHFGVAVQQSEHILKAQTQAVELAKRVEQERALAQTISKVRQSLELDNLFQSVATEVRQLLRADRVAVFKFYPEKDWEGEFISEDVVDNWPSALEQKVYDHCFGEQFSQQYLAGRVQAVADIHAAGLNECHIDILGKFQVQANLVVPVLKAEQLWGLLCIHQCEAPRQWREDEIEFVQHIAEHLSVALKQTDVLSQVRYQSDQQKALTGVISRIRESIDLATIFTTTTREVRQLLQADRVGIFALSSEDFGTGEFVAEDRVEGLPSVVAEKIQDHCFGENYAQLYQKGRIYISNNVAAAGLQDCHVQILERFQVKANVVVPLLKGEELWGLLCIHQCFEPREWKASELEFIGQIAEQLGVALKQEDQLEQLKQQTTRLADAEFRERSLNRQKLVSATIDKIRQSLDIQKIFDTTTYEVRQLMKAERVAIYQFNPDWSGDFVAESIAEGWIALVGVQPTVHDTHLMETQGGRYAQQSTFAVEDIYQAGHRDCHIALLEELQVRAYAIVPIMVGSRLWGLLAAYQNSAPRHWEADEVELLAQIGGQLGVALQQAEGVAQVQQQAEALQKATERQRGLSITIDKIRRSLDIDTIFNTTTQEVRQLLAVDRVAIYRFHEGWRGSFVADSIADAWQPTSPPPTVIEKVLATPEKNGQYPRNEVFVPISQGEKLWGLLMAYQTSNPRYWEDAEVDLLAQVGSQLGIALQQAELLQQTQKQTAQLNQTLQQLQGAQAKLVQGEKMASLGQMMAGIAHEINNPVSFVFSNAQPAQEYTNELLSLLQLYQQQYPEPNEIIQRKCEEIEIDFLAEDLPKLIGSMKMGAVRIQEIVKSMQVFSRLDEAACKAVDIHQGIDSTLLILSHRFKAQAHRPVIEVIKVYGELPLVYCYASQLNQVFMNLLSNAVDALEEVSGREEPLQIKVMTHWVEERDSVVIQIEDNGCGISETVLDNIFDPFFTTKPVGKGTGLGLSISYQIITELHHGKLMACRGERVGTTFQIEIPIA